MVVNAHGVIASGYAGSGVQVSLPGGSQQMIRPGPAGFPAFLSDDRIVYNSGAGEVRSANLDGSADAFFMAEGSAPLYAAAGHALTFTPEIGVRTSWSFWSREAASLGMAPDGTAYLVADYQAGREIAAYRPGQLTPEYILPDARPNLGHFAALDHGRFVYADGSNTLHAWGLPSPAQTQPAFSPQIVEVDGEAWIAYGTHASGLILHPLADASRGFVLTRGAGFGHVLWSDAPGTINAAWAGNQGEVGPIQRVTVRLAEAQPFEAPSAPAVPVLRRFDYPCYAGYSWVPPGATAPGNCQVLTAKAGEGDGQDWREMADTSRPVFADGPSIARSTANETEDETERRPELLGHIGTIEGAGPGYDYAHSAIFQAYLSECFRRGRRPTFGDDGNVTAKYPQDVLSLLPSWGLPTVECYPDHGETVPQTLGRLDAKVLSVINGWRGSLGVIIPCYTQQGNWDKPNVFAIAERLYDWHVWAKGRLMVVWAFPRERGGVGGPLEDPDMMTLGERIVASAIAKGTPALPAIGAAAPEPEPEPDPEPGPDEPEPSPDPEPEPEPEPAPLPPASSDPFPSATEVTDMDPEIVGVLGPGGMFGRVDPSEPDRIYFDRSSVGAHERVEVTKPDDKFALRFVDANVIVNFADRWGSGEIDGESVDLDRQFETRPPDQRGSHERPDVVRMPDGRIVAYVAHTRDGRQFTSAPLTLVRGV